MGPGTSRRFKVCHIMQAIFPVKPYIMQHPKHRIIQKFLFAIAPLGLQHLINHITHDLPMCYDFWINNTQRPSDDFIYILTVNYAHSSIP